MSIVAEISALRAMNIRELRERYFQVFGEVSRSRNRDYLWRRIAYGIQVQAEGAGLSDRARARAEELARDSDLRVRNCVSPRVRAQTARPASSPPTPRKRDPRLPPAGAVLRRHAHGATHEVLVGEQGYTYAGKPYRSLSAVAIKITGTHQSGFAFFGLTKPEGEQ
jgi:hypothetical protein